MTMSHAASSKLIKILRNGRKIQVTCGSCFSPGSANDVQLADVMKALREEGIMIPVDQFKIHGEATSLVLTAYE